MRTIARERIAPRAAEIDASHEFPWDVVELFREHGIFGLLFDEEHGGTGTGTLLALVAIEEVSKVCATSGLILAVQELGSLALKLAGDGRAEGAIPAEARLGRVARRLRADRGGLRLGLRGDADDRAPGRRRVRPRRLEALHHQRRRSRTCTRSSPRPIRSAGHSGISAFVVESDTPGFEVARARAEDGHLRLDHRRARVRGRAHPRGEPARRGGRGLQDRDARPRPLAPGSRRAGPRDRPGRDRLRARVRQDAGDDGEADRRAPAGRGEARGHGDAPARRRAGFSTASGAWSTRTRPTRS